MGRKIKVNISPKAFQATQGKTIKMKIKRVKPQYLTPREKLRLS